MSDWWAKDPVVSPAPGGGSGGGDWWKDDPVVKSAPAARSGSTAGDVGRSINSGLNRGADALLGLPGDAWNGLRYLANKALGYDDPINDVLPTSESLRKRREGNVGPDYQPQTTPGKYAQTIGEFLPGAALAPEDSLGKGLVKFGVVPGAASEAAGQATEGTPLEPYVHVWMASAVQGF
jgi:hypothetical protein